MKKVLLATTALFLTAGVASAEVSFSGTAQAAVSNTTSAAGVAGGNELTTHIDFNVAVSGASDNGITFSTGFGYDAGEQVDAGDFELDAPETGWGTASPNITIGYNGITITADGEGVADLYNGDVNSGDLAISGSMGGLSFGLTTGITKDVDDGSMSLGYKMGDVAFSYASTNNADGVSGRDGSIMSVSYTMGDMVLSASSDDDGNVEAIQKIGVAYTMDAIKVSFSAATNGTSGSSVGDDWDVSVSYTTGAITASVATDEDSVSKISASYDLGGGANVFFANRSGEVAGADKGFTAVGVNFAF